MQHYRGYNPARNHVTDWLMGISADVMAHGAALWVGALAVCVVVCAVVTSLWLSRDVVARDATLDADVPLHLPRS